MRIESTPEIDRRFRVALRKAGRREIGGMLMAEQLAPSHFRIIDFSLDSFSGSHIAFRRDPEVHLQKLSEFFEQTGQDFARYNYLGEWHSHPSFAVLPSGEDMRTMTTIVEDRGADITFAALLILKLRYRFWLEHSLTIFQRGCMPVGATLA